MDTRLLLVEGCPGTGKSSMAQAVWRQLRRAGLPARWYYEDEQPHPVAATRGIANARGFRDYGRATLMRWRDFVSRMRRSQEIAVIDAHYFQNVVMPLLRADVTPKRIQRLVQRMTEFCAPLEPVLVYLHQPDYAATMRHILDERGPRFEELYVGRNDASPYARKHGLQGFDGLVQTWVEARSLMEGFLEELELTSLAIDSAATDREGCETQVCDALGLQRQPPPALEAAALRAYEGTYTYRRDKAPRRAAGVTRFGNLDVQRRVGGLPRVGPLHHQEQVEFEVRLEADGLTMHGYDFLFPETNRLIPLERDTFDIAAWPFQMHFERQRREVVAATRKSETTRWGLTGQRYPRLDPRDRDEAGDRAR